MAEVLTESFCERCGTRYTFESAKPRVKRLKGVKVLSRGLKNFVLSDDSSLDEAMAAARSDTEREVTSQQLDAFHKTFNFCMTCRQYTCANCWNEAEGTCLTCSPHLGHEIMPAPFPNLDPLGATIALESVDGATGNGAAANGANGNGHAAPAYDAAAWPASDAWPRHDLTEDAPAAAGSTYASSDIDEIDVTARMAALTAIGSGQVATPEPVEAVEVEVEAVAETPAEAELEAVESEVEAVESEVEAVAAEPEPEPEPIAAPPAPAPIRPATPAAPAGSLTHDEVAAAASAQTADLLHRFRPGESLDAELDAYEREHAEPTTPIVTDAVIAEAAVADSLPIVEPEPVADVAPTVADAPRAPVGVDALIVAAAAGSLDAPSAADVQDEPEPVIELVAEPEADVEALAEPIVASAPEPEVVAAPEPEPVAVTEPDPVVAVEPEPDRAAEVAAAAALAAATARQTDVVAQPTWRIVAPDAEPAAPTVVPPVQTPTTPATPPAATAQPQWPADPQWPDQRPAAGLPFLGRPVQPTGGLDSLWAESNREVAAAPAAVGLPAAPAGVQPCVSCGLSLSATARFCRRCGTAQR